MRNGGRTGIGFQFGLNYLLGKEVQKVHRNDASKKVFVTKKSKKFKGLA